MTKNVFGLLSFFLITLSCFAQSNQYSRGTVVYKNNMIQVSVQPAEAAIYINGTFAGYGIAEFKGPANKKVAVIRCECQGYKPILTKFYGEDKRKNISFTLQDDGYYRLTAASGIVNKYFTVDIDPLYYKIEGDKIDVSAAWKLLHQILLNYFDEIALTDMYGGYVQTPWAYKTFQLSDTQMRNRVTIRDISTPDRVAFQIKISSEVAAAMAAKHGEFTEVDRIAKEYEPLIEELQTRIGKVKSL